MASPCPPVKPMSAWAVGSLTVNVLGVTPPAVRPDTPLSHVTPAVIPLMRTGRPPVKPLTASKVTTPEVSCDAVMAAYLATSRTPRRR